LKTTNENTQPQPETQPRSHFGVVHFLFIVLLTAFLVYILPNVTLPFLKERIRTNLEKALRCRTSIESIGFNPFTVSFLLRDFKIYDSTKEDCVILAVKEISIRPEIQPLFKKKFVPEIISFTNPIITYRKFYDGSSAWDFLKNTGAKKEQKIMPAREILVKNGQLHYIQELGNKKNANIDFSGIFIYIKSGYSPKARIENIPLYSTIKGRSHINSEPRGTISFDGYANFIDPKVSFYGDIKLDNISLTYFSNLYPEDASIEVLEGSFDLATHIQCARDKLVARPNVTVSNLHLKVTQDYKTKNIFEVPVLLVVDFFDIYKDKLSFTFDITGDISNPKFHLRETLREQIASVVSESIVKTIQNSPKLFEKLGSKVVAVGTNVKDVGKNVGENVGTVVDAVTKPFKEFFKGLRND